MFKRYFSLALTLIFVAISVCAVHAQETLNLKDLKQCGKIFAYSGDSSAYFYGFNKTTLYSAKVLPEGITRYVSIDGTIRSVCHDDNNAYALFEGNRNYYSVIKLNMTNGSYRIYELGTLAGIDDVSFAATDSELFLIDNNGTYPTALCLDYNGNRKCSLSFYLGVKNLFTNGGNAYARASTGDVYKLSGGGKSYCTSIDRTANFENAGAGYVYTKGGQLVSLKDGSTQSFTDKHVVKTKNGTFKDNSGTIFAAVGNKTAALNSDYNCTVKDKPAQVTQSNGNSNNSDINFGEKLNIYDGVVVGIEAGTTVAQLKKSFPDIKSIYDLNEDEVTSGKLRTGYSVRTSDNICFLAVRGDINSSGTVNSTDVTALMRYLTDGQSLTDCQLKAADYNLDGNINNTDLVLLARAVG